MIFTFFAIGATLGVAGQYFAMLLACAVMFPWLWMEQRQIPWRAGWAVTRTHVALSLGLVIWLVIATLINEKNLDSNPWHYVAGHLFWIAIIPLWGWTRRGDASFSEAGCGHVFRFVIWIWALVCLAQVLNGWHLTGSDMTLLPSGFYRARGFYSHPLTLAYALLVIWPVILGRSLRTGWAGLNGRDGLTLVASAFMIWSTASRTVQFVAIAEFVAVGLLLFSKKSRWLAAALVVVASVGVGVTDNPVSQRFKVVNEADHASHYPDDRLAFWDAHWQMIKERPITGHGIHLDSEYRAPYYAALGLEEFSKKYEAHNMFIAVMSEGGAVALLLFVAWLAWVATLIGKMPDRWWRTVGWIGLGGFVLGGMTQNAFQDSEVRYVLAFVVAWVAAGQKQS